MNWLLLRGLVREQRHWGSFPERLRSRLPEGARVLTLDLPGMGTEAARPSPSSIAAITDDLRERFLEIRGPQGGDWGLFAVSLGGMICLDWCSRHPQDFSRAMVCNTSAANLSGPFQRLKPAALPIMWKALRASDLEVRERAILSLVSNRPPSELEEVALAWAEVGRAIPLDRGVFYRQMTAGSTSRAPDFLAVPLRVLCSDGDRMVAPACSKKIAARLGAELRVHPDAGHDLPLDDPEWVAGEILAWDREASPS